LNAGRERTNPFRTDVDRFSIRRREGCGAKTPEKIYLKKSPTCAIMIEVKNPIIRR